ncbi:hypothetical protein C8R46DRAFT_1232209 [Mycena filopes]|nr:hypothetical protein C8R46DRAFT_1232209 [Mycena filopes]
MVFGTVTHSIIILRTYAIWDERNNISRVLLATFVVCIAATTAFGILSELQLQPRFKFSPIFSTCLLDKIPEPVISAFDVLIILISVYNALDRPHKTHSDVIESLQTDGLKFLFALFVLRTGYLVSSIVSNPGQCFTVVATCWSFTSIISARLQLRLDGLKLNEACEELELPLSYPLRSNTSESLWWEG